MRTIEIPKVFADLVESSTSDYKSHVACVFRDVSPKKIQRFMSYGSNNENIHAEVDACNAFRKKVGRNHKRVNKLAIFVGRHNHKNSRPCWHCYLYMKNLNRAGYNISTVYYTTGSKKTVAKTSLTNMLAEPFIITSGRVSTTHNIPPGFITINHDAKKYICLANQKEMRFECGP